MVVGMVGGSVLSKLRCRYYRFDRAWDSMLDCHRTRIVRVSMNERVWYNKQKLYPLRINQYFVIELNFATTDHDIAPRKFNDDDFH
jgi:hypothetical protein